MAYESNLPVNSERFSQTLWKDTNSRIWTGKTGEYYRFLDPADMPYINIKDYGAVGDGVTDDTYAWEAALSAAKAQEMPLFIPAGQYPVTVAVDSVDMNGCSGIYGTGELLFTSTGNPDRPLLLWSGTKTLIASGLSVSIGQTSITVGTGLSISKGDTIFVASNEAVYPDLDVSSASYKKGGRFTVESYNSSTGELTCYEPSYYDITSAYIYLNDSRPKVSLKDVSISIVGNQDKKGIEIRAGELFVDSVQVNGFGRFGINSSSSLCRIARSRVYAEAIPSTSTGYSLQCSGLSDVIFTDSLFYGNRHGVACGDSGWWRTTDVGGVDNTVIALPPIVRGAGCRIEGKSYALDSHAGTTLLDVYNCDIYGGAIMGGLEMYLSGCRIHQGASDMAVRFGRDRTLNSRNFNSKFGVSNCEVYASTQAFGIYADLYAVNLSDILVYATATVSPRMMIDYNSASLVANWRIRNISHFGNAGDTCEYFIRTANGFPIEGCNLEYAKMRIELRNASEIRKSNHIQIIKSSITTGNGSALEVNYFDLNKVMDFSISDCTFYDSPEGIRVRGSRNLIISGCQFQNNVMSVYVMQSSGAAIPIVMTSNVIDQDAGNVIGVQGGQTVPATLIGNIFQASAAMSANLTIAAKYGNVGLDDKLKTSLTSATTAKYGAATGSGDLTLS